MFPYNTTFQSKLEQIQQDIKYFIPQTCQICNSQQKLEKICIDQFCPKTSQFTPVCETCLLVKIKSENPEKLKNISNQFNHRNSPDHKTISIQQILNDIIVKDIQQFQQNGELEFDQKDLTRIFSKLGKNMSEKLQDIVDYFQELEETCSKIGIYIKNLQQQNLVLANVLENPQI
ncbi:hypothetical protein PPERSA_01188 [Pseudocohnilembus persalinus]|uniref:Uncharacterized protein n=1 Tax=Pseudocohnilembus persalinus TaxID=266149 RepID=A0A0V0R136_PSEPJ|nr:hypothetical protein PPERSA_01188 [Pseudocohnilembus persalinus]|eukprot:KRX08258.1 hypothetical protein PPERSA_01188 [Pseudocohnilembus persalinus]